MDRYSNLYGTVGGGSYSPMGYSAGLPDFLNKIGAVNASITIDAVRNALAGFPKMDASAQGFNENYFSQPKNDLPVAVRYAPMHLYKKAGMPKNMQAFCALSVNGNENKQSDRVTTYSQTFYIAREHMHEAVKVNRAGTEITYNYLDQLFGTHLLTHEEMGNHRQGVAAVNYDAMPAKVEPAMRLEDAAVVFSAVSTVFEEKAVVIRLEKGCAFNKRAWELLIPMYALMPPRLAAETGFATYQDPKSIRGMVAETSMRIFLVPAECDLTPAVDANTLVIDLNDPATVPQLAGGEFDKVLLQWYEMPWDMRQVAMEKVFADTAATFNNKELFVQRSQDFFADPLVKGAKAMADKRTVSTLEELESKLAAKPWYRTIPWVRERSLLWLAKGVNVNELTAKALYQCLYGGDDATKQKNLQLYRLGMELMPLDTGAAAQYVSQLHGQDVKAAQDKKYLAALAEQKGTFEQQSQAQKTAYDNQIAELKTKIEELNTKMQQDQAAARKAFDDEHQAHLATQQNLAATQQTLTAEQQKAAGLEQQLTDANAVIEKARTAYTELRREAEGYKAQIDGAKAEAAKAVSAARSKQAEAQQAQADADKARGEAEALRAKADKTIQENNKRMVIFAAAGFLVAALIFGVIMLIVGLVGGKDAEPSTVPTTVATEPTTEATEPSTEATEPSTEATEPTTQPTEPQTPDFTDWSNDTAALWLVENLPEVETITLDLADIPEELLAVEGYTAVARVQLIGEENYAVLLQAAGTVSDDETEPADDATEPVDDATEPVDDATEPVDDATEPADDTTEPAEPVELTAISVEEARLVLTTQDFVLVIYGDDTAPVSGIRFFEAITEETAETADSWDVAGEAHRLDALLAELLEDEHWWRTVTEVSTSEEVLIQAAEELVAEVAPNLAITCGEKTVYVFRFQLTATAERQVAIMTEQGHTALNQDNLMVLVAGAE